MYTRPLTIEQNSRAMTKTSIPECINVRKRFGKRYRIAFDPCYSSFNVPKDKLDPWYMVIPCKYGGLFAWSDTRLVADVTGHPRIASKLLKFDCVEVEHRGDPENLTVHFDVKDFDQVAAVMKPKKRKRLSEERRRKLAEAGAKYRFPRGAQGQYSDQECDPSGRDDVELIERGPRRKAASIARSGRQPQNDISG